VSRAFVSEESTAATASALPERPVSAGPNLVTARGLALIEAEIARLEKVQSGTESEDLAHLAAVRDLRYWRARRATATVVPPPPAQPAEVAFGCQVTLRPVGGRAVTYRIVGEDEADPAQGLLNWASPLAQALMGAVAGDDVDIGGGRPTVTVQRIDGG
jgi:transcription elongation GreA/GreB family factor